MESIGNRITALRKQQGYTQEALADHCHVSSQAVSKWENDLAIPDVTTLVAFATLFNTSVDYLLRGDQVKEVRMTKQENRKPLEELVVRLTVDTEDGDTVRMNLPAKIIEILANSSNDLNYNGKDILTKENIELILNLIQKGTIGEILTVDSADGDHVKIFVE